MIKKIVFCLILLCCISTISFAENPDNVNDIGDFNKINTNIEKLQSENVYNLQKDYYINNSANNSGNIIEQNNICLGEDYNNNSISNENLDNNNFIYNTDNVTLYANPSIDLIKTNTYLPIYRTDFDKIDSIPSYYNLADHGYVSSVKDQGQTNHCWAFAGVAALESCILKATGVEYNLSEDRLAELSNEFLPSDDILPDEKKRNGGGNLFDVIGYYTSWLGAVKENYSLQNPVNIVNVQNVLFIKPSHGIYDNKNDIKKAILTYGAVATSYYHNNSYQHGFNYYNNKNKTTDHAVVIVGWDDNYDKNNFYTPATSNGAWIVKNSWGNTWGNKGYFYISYDDVSFAKIQDSYTFILNDSTNYYKNYQYDIQKNSELPYKYASYFKNIFSASDNGELVAISSYFNKGVKYNIIINIDGNKYHEQRFISNIDGYFTVKLNKKLKISKGKQFEVIINNPKKSFAICNQSLLSNSKKLPENVSMVSTDGINWAVPKDYVFCIKAFTTSVSNNLKARPNLTVDALTKYYHGPEQLIPKLTNSNTKNIQININNRTYYRTVDNKGIAKLNIDLKSGKYNASVKYVDSNFDIAVNALVTVKPTIIGKDITKYFKNDTQYNVIVYDNSGNLLRNTLVMFNINGIFYNRTTNDNGVATLNINLPPEDYIITATNLVSTEECSNKVKVLSIIESEDLSMHYLDGSTFNAKLLDGHGNPYPDQTITFNVNGVLYNRITDNDGIARLNIRLSQGSYIITSSFNGCNKSNNIIVT